MSAEPPVDEELPTPCGRTIWTLDGPDGVRSHADNCTDCWYAELHQQRRAVNAALTLLDGMWDRPDRPATHSQECHNYHQACLVARLREALDPGAATSVVPYGNHVLVNAALVEEHERYETALTDLAEHGTRHDLTPTQHASFDWHAYLRSADQHVRDTAHRALNENGDAS